MARRIIIVVSLVIHCMAISPAFAGTWIDDFEDGNLDPWQRENPPMGGEIWNDEDGICSGQYANAPEGVFSGLELKVENAGSWKDYSVVFKVKLVEELAGPGEPLFSISFRSLPTWEENRQEEYQAGVYPGTKKAIFYEVGQGVRKISEVPLPFDISEDTWYKLEVIAEGDHFEFYINDELIESFDDDSRLSGTIWLGVRNAHVHFDDVVITGPEIPNGGPGFAVTSQSKLATMWGSIKRGR